MNIPRIIVALGLAIASAPALAQGYPPQMTPNGAIIGGFAGHMPGSQGLNQANRDFGEVISGYHTYTDPTTGYRYQQNNFRNQWVGPGGQHAQTWGNVPPPGYWRQLYR